MNDILGKIETHNKIRSYHDIQRAVIGQIDLDKYNIDIDDQVVIFEAIRYGIKIAHGHGYERGYVLSRRKEIREAFRDI